MVQIYYFLVGDGERWCENICLYIFFVTRVTIMACNLLIRSPESSFSMVFRSSCVVCRELTPSQKLQSSQHLVCSVCRVRRRETVNFMTLTYRRDKFEKKVQNWWISCARSWSYKSYDKKMHYFYEHFLLYSPA